MDEVLLKHINKAEDSALLKPFVDLSYSKERWVIRNVRTLQEKATKYEIEVANYLDSKGIHFISQAPFYFKETDSVYFADFYIPRGRVVVEVDGDYHNEGEKFTSDLIRDNYFASKHIRVIRIANLEVGTSKVPDKLGFLRPKNHTKPPQNNNTELDDGLYDKMLRFVKEKLEEADEGATIIFKTRHKNIALNILKPRRTVTCTRHELRQEIHNIKKDKKLQVYALFVSKAAKNWMSRHLLNPVTENYIEYMRNRPEGRMIIIPESYRELNQDAQS